MKVRLKIRIPVLYVKKNEQTVFIFNIQSTIKKSFAKIHPPVMHLHKKYKIYVFIKKGQKGIKML